MNLTASAIKSDYTRRFGTGLNKYIQLNEYRPYESLEQYRSMMIRLGLLVEIWSTIDSLNKEKHRG